MSEKPAFPRPDEEGIRDATKSIFKILEYFPPLSMIEDSLFVRALLANGFTTAQSMWAIHDACMCGALITIKILLHPREGGHIRYLVTEDDPPAGLKISRGKLDFGHESIRGWWGGMAFWPEPSKVEELRKSIATESGQADTSKDSGQRMPDNLDVLDLCKKLSERKDGTTMISVALEFTREPKNRCPKAKALLRQARRYRHLWEADK